MKNNNLLQKSITKIRIKHKKMVLKNFNLALISFFGLRLIKLVFRFESLLYFSF